MFWKKVKVLTLIFSTVFGFSMHNNALAKTPEINFHPTKAWIVGTDPANATSAGPQICAIQNEFNNGFIIRLDGSERWVEALSVNFRQNIFTPGDSYDVSLSVPGVTQKQLPATASNETILSIDLQGQKDLYKSMRDSAVLDLRLDGNAFRFYMVGFGAAAGGFETCMSKSSSPTPPPSMSESFYTPEATAENEPVPETVNE